MAHLTGCNGGKGSQRRHGANQKAYADNWDLIFGKKTEEPEAVKTNDTGESDATESSDV